MEIDRERNRMALERIAFHLDEAMRFCNQLDLSGLGPLEQKEWDSRMKTCKDAIINMQYSISFRTNYSHAENPQIVITV
jgi:hypothetical protein